MVFCSNLSTQVAKSLGENGTAERHSFPQAQHTCTVSPLPGLDLLLFIPSFLDIIARLMGIPHLLCFTNLLWKFVVEEKLYQQLLDNLGVVLYEDKSALKEVHHK
jgi:hypothetical protein